MKTDYNNMLDQGMNSYTHHVMQEITDDRVARIIDEFGKLDDCVQAFVAGYIQAIVYKKSEG